MSEAVERLPVHGFVLAGGNSARMGRDKALLEVCGKTLVEIAVEKLRAFCAHVSICGNRGDLSGIASVVHEERMDCGPVAGIEAGLLAAKQPWAMFVPVDVPLVPAELLQSWAAAVIEKAKAGCGASYLLVNGERQPAFAMLRKECGAVVTAAIDQRVRRLDELMMQVDDAESAGWLWVVDAAKVSPKQQPTKLDLECWFSNVNTPQDFAEAEAWAGFEERRAWSE